MQQFEYKIVRMARKSMWTGKVDFEALEKELNELGKQGWEVISSTNSQLYENKLTGTFIILKRVK
jgi:hypothetical protein